MYMYDDEILYSASLPQSTVTLNDFIKMSILCFNASFWTLIWPTPVKYF